MAFAVVLILLVVGECDPAAVFGPTELSAAQSVVVEPEFLSNNASFLRIEIVQVDFHGLIDEHELFAVGGPVRAITVAGAEFGQDLFGASALGGSVVSWP